MAGDPLSDYFLRVNPTLNRPEEGAARLPDTNLYKAWDRLARQIGEVAPKALDRCRSFRNRFDAAVK